MDNTEKISIWDQFWISCTKPSQYKKLIGVSKGKIVIFVLLVTLITTLFGTVIDLFGLNVSIGGVDNFIENRLPKFQLKNGALTADEDMDFTVSGVRIIMNTKEKTVSESEFNNQAAMEIYFSNTQMVSQNHAIGQKLTINFADYKDAVVSNDTLLKYVPIVYFLAILTMCLSFVFTLIGYLLFAAFMAWLANWSFKLRKQKIPFGAVYQIALYARVPCMLIGTVGSLIGFPFFASTIWWCISYIATYELILFAFREPKDNER